MIHLADAFTTLVYSGVAVELVFIGAPGGAPFFCPRRVCFGLFMFWFAFRLLFVSFEHQNISGLLLQFGQEPPLTGRKA